jgi:hypothetical protein
VGAPLAWALVVVVPLLVIEVLALFQLLARRPDLGVANKAVWVVVIFAIPIFGVLTYVLLRPPGLASGKATRDPATGSTMQQLRDLIAAHDSGSVDDDQYAAAKAELFGL